jgi:HD-GYP domain-containing protein (c-di-GMP phosphodiesterase class II)
MSETGCFRSRTPIAIAPRNGHLAANIHDIGKIALPAELLSHSRKASGAEMELIRTHPQISSDLLERVGFPTHARELVLQHQERLDGSG